MRIVRRNLYQTPDSSVYPVVQLNSVQLFKILKKIFDKVVVVCYISSMVTRQELLRLTYFPTLRGRRKYNLKFWAKALNLRYRILYDLFYTRTGIRPTTAVISDDVGLKLISELRNTHNIWSYFMRSSYDPLFIPYRPGRNRKSTTVCDRWWTFANFYDDMGLCPPNSHLHLLPHATVYSPDNCCWHMIVTGVEIEGETRELTEWCKLFKMTLQIVYHRMKKFHLSVHEALLLPHKPRLPSGPNTSVEHLRRFSDAQLLHEQHRRRVALAEGQCIHCGREQRWCTKWPCWDMTQVHQQSIQLSDEMIDLLFGDEIYERYQSRGDRPNAS